MWSVEEIPTFDCDSLNELSILIFSVVVIMHCTFRLSTYMTDEAEVLIISCMMQFIMQPMAERPADAFMKCGLRITRAYKEMYGWWRYCIEVPSSGFVDSYACTSTYLYDFMMSCSRELLAQFTIYHRLRTSCNFLIKTWHNYLNVLVQNVFQKSGEKVSCQFHVVLCLSDGGRRCLNPLRLTRFLRICWSSISDLSI